ncbi:MAG: damage-control phosphatase ARMT1 family protein [Desulfomonilaceae bacterium]
MLLQPDCISCIHKASLSAIRQLTSDADEIKAVISEIMQSPTLRDPAWELTSPEVFESALAKISSVFNTSDPFQVLKKRQNERAMALYPWLKTLVEESKDRLRTACHLAIIGNSLDVIWSGGTVEVEPLIRQQLCKPVLYDRFLNLEKRIRETRLVLILGDNAGEIVFDRLFIETLKSIFDVEVVFVVRSVPALNDATAKEAAAVELDEIARIVENGIDGPLPGTVLARCSEQLRKLTEEADLILSKGGGNFDSLGEESHLHDKILFMLMSKCVPYCGYFGTRMCDPILAPPRREV